MAFFYFFDWRPFVNYKWAVYGIYAVNLLLLAVAYFVAPVIRGNRGWIVLGSNMQFQPSEFMKVGLVLVYAYFFARHHTSIANPKTILTSFLLVVLPAGLVISQPDLGTAIVLGGLWFGFLLVSGLRLKHLAMAVLIFLVLSFVAWSYFLADYQRDRITGLLNPSRDPLGINYSPAQSKIAIGSAGFWGKGYHQGTQTQLGYLPDASTDFIFSAFIEEWGIVGGFLIIFVFAYFLFVILRIGVIAETNFEKFICLGAAIIFSAHFVINVGSATGLLPVVGLPFPFLSYGGSSLLTNFFLSGIILSIAKRLA